MTSKNHTFEIQLKDGDIWVKKETCPREIEAIRLAKSFNAQSWCQGTRVIRSWTRSDGTPVETEIFRQVRDAADIYSGNLSNKKDRIYFLNIDKAPSICRDLHSYANFESRQFINRVLSDHINELYITPTEILYNAVEMQGVQSKSTALRKIIEQVAYLQTRETSQTIKDRREEIYDAFDAILQKARDSVKYKLPKINEGFSQLLAALPENLSQEDRDYYGLIALSSTLISRSQTRTLNIKTKWIDKLELLCELASMEIDLHAIELLDGVIADIMSTNALSEISNSDLIPSATLSMMVQLAQGALITDKPQAFAVVDSLNALISQGKLPISQRSLYNRIEILLRTPTSLNPRNMSQDPETMSKVSKSMWIKNKLMGDANMAAAMTWRFMYITSQAGRPQKRFGLMSAVDAMVDRATALCFLCYLSRSQEHEEYASIIHKMLSQFMGLVKSLNDFCQRSLSKRDRIARATNAHASMLSSNFPDHIKNRVTDHIDEMLLGYIIDEKILEHFDTLNLPLRERIYQLVQFSTSVSLPKGKAATWVYRYTLDLLGTIDFKTHFIEGIDDPGAAKKALSDFYILLSTSFMPA